LILLLEMLVCTFRNLRFHTGINNQAHEKAIFNQANIMREFVFAASSFGNL